MRPTEQCALRIFELTMVAVAAEVAAVAVAEVAVAAEVVAAEVAEVAEVAVVAAVVEVAVVAEVAVAVVAVAAEVAVVAVVAVVAAEVAPSASRWTARGRCPRDQRVPDERCGSERALRVESRLACPTVRTWVVVDNVGRRERSERVSSSDRPELALCDDAAGDVLRRRHARCLRPRVGCDVVVPREVEGRIGVRATAGHDQVAVDARGGAALEVWARCLIREHTGRGSKAQVWPETLSMKAVS